MIVAVLLVLSYDSITSLLPCGLSEINTLYMSLCFSDWDGWKEETDTENATCLFCLHQATDAQHIIAHMTVRYS